MSVIPPPHYVRLKRYNLTIFIHCDVNHDTVQAIKERYEKLTGRTFYHVKLFLGRQNLEDFSTLYNCGIESEGAELVVVHSKGMKNDGTGEHIWEEIEEAMRAPDLTKEEKQIQEGGDGTESRENGENMEENGSASTMTRPEEKNTTFVESNVGFIGV